MMIVIAIIGILSMIAIPAYNDFTIRSKVSEGLSLASGAKLSVMEYYMSQGSWPHNNSVAGMPRPDSIRGDFVRSVAVSDNQIIVTFGDSAGKGLTGKNLVLSANDNGGSINWLCNGDGIESKYLPQNCRVQHQDKV
jgi:type IV pilus assembly protein PilA